MSYLDFVLCWVQIGNIKFVSELTRFDEFPEVRFPSTAVFEIQYRTLTVHSVHFFFFLVQHPELEKTHTFSRAEEIFRQIAHIFANRKLPNFDVIQFKWTTF